MNAFCRCPGRTKSSLVVDECMKVSVCMCGVNCTFPTCVWPTKQRTECNPLVYSMWFLSINWINVWISCIALDIMVVGPIVIIGCIVIQFIVMLRLWFLSYCSYYALRSMPVNNGKWMVASSIIKMNNYDPMLQSNSSSAPITPTTMKWLSNYYKNVFLYYKLKISSKIVMKSLH